jgi:hypothetical protein
MLPNTIGLVQYGGGGRGVALSANQGNCGLEDFFPIYRCPIPMKKKQLLKVVGNEKQEGVRKEANVHCK